VILIKNNRSNLYWSENWIIRLSPYKLNRYEVELILKLVLGFLNLKDVFKLRDKYEGQLFYDKIKMKLGSRIACDNFFL
jgi:hypothetical protein